LGERLDRTQEVSGSSPLSSIASLPQLQRLCLLGGEGKPPKDLRDYDVSYQCHLIVDPLGACNASSSEPRLPDPARVRTDLRSPAR
jgi:hypothetical protein